MAEELRKDDEPPKIPEVLPVPPLRDIVIFPFMIVPLYVCLLYTSPSPRDRQKSRMPSSA